jgi:UDP-2-acetamido-2-deoxy-ribo-hexuluronate aminotransferase
MMNFIDLDIQQSKIRPMLDAAIDRVLSSGQYIMGPQVLELEATLSKYTGSKYCITCANGTDALQLALMAIDIKPGDEIITTPFTFMATSEVAALLGAIPVFVDIDPLTYNIDASQIEDAITDKTKAIIPVSLYGLMSDMDTINDIANRHNLTVIEDGAQSFGATYQSRKSCNASHIGTTSFFPSKPLGCYGDGGAIFTNDESIAQKVKEYRVHGQSARYLQTSIGVNSRLDTIQAAILIEKLKIFDDEVKLRQEIGIRYNEQLEGLVKVPHIPSEQTHVFGQYTIEVEQRDLLQAKLSEHNIPTCVYYPILLNEQPALEGRCRVLNSLPNAKKAVQSVLSLPMHPYLEEAEQKLITTHIAEIIS